MNKKVYYDTSTTNKSFIEVSKYLAEDGIKNNKLMLSIYNKNLIGVDPYNPNLSDETKREIIEECTENLWYFLREVARVLPTEHDKPENSTNFKLTRTNYTRIFCYLLNKSTWSYPSYIEYTCTIPLICIHNFMFQARTFIARTEIIYKELIELLPEYIKLNRSMVFYNKDINKVPMILGTSEGFNNWENSDIVYISGIKDIRQHLFGVINEIIREPSPGRVFIFNDDFSPYPPENSDLYELLDQYKYTQWDDSIYDNLVRNNSGTEEYGHYLIDLVAHSKITGFIIPAISLKDYDKDMFRTALGFEKEKQ